MLKRLLLRATLAIAAFLVMVYAGDCAVYKLRGSPQGKVHINRLLTVPLKGDKQEIDDLGSGDAPCSVSLFGQDGLPACWKLRRNPTQETKI